jgi:hypothetical protein
MFPVMVDLDDGSLQVAVLACLTGCRFRCLENYLKNVTYGFVLQIYLSKTVWSLRSCKMLMERKTF